MWVRSSPGMLCGVGDLGGLVRVCMCVSVWVRAGQGHVNQGVGGSVGV